MLDKELALQLETAMNTLHPYIDTRYLPVAPGDPALDKELALQLRATLGGIDAGDRKAFRRLVCMSIL